MTTPTPTPKNLEKIKQSSYIGISNLGNTCFLNSCIQVLFHTEDLFDIFYKKDNYSKIHDANKNNNPKNYEDVFVTREWIDIKRQMVAITDEKIRNVQSVQFPKLYMDIRSFITLIHNVAQKKNRLLFTGWSQNDLPEFLLFIVECFHNSISREVTMTIQGNAQTEMDKTAVECYGLLKTIYEKEYSEIMNDFYGIYVSVISSLGKHKIHTVKPEHFFLLDLPIPSLIVGKNVSLYDCFDLFTQTEILEKENAWFNEKTNKKENIEKEIRFWNLPKILIISLKRFSGGGGGETIRKNNTFVDFPLDNLDLSKYIVGYGPSAYKYKLYGICNHYGNTEGGHYTSFVNTGQGRNIDEWTHFNDADVTVGNSTGIVTQSAYCLFYSRYS